MSLESGGSSLFPCPMQQAESRKISGVPKISVEYDRVHTKRSKQTTQKLSGSGGACTFFIVPHLSLRQEKYHFAEHAKHMQT